jgi:hypothetical protein
MTIENITTSEGLEVVNITHEDGSFTSMTKEAYDLSQVEHLTEIPTE